MCVLPGILEHLPRYGPLSPIRGLKFLVGCHAGVGRQEVGEGGGGEGERASGLPRVKDVNQVEAKVSLEPNHIRIAAMEHLDNAGIRKNAIQQVHAGAQR